MNFERASILGAEVSDIDLTPPHDDATIQEIRDALARYQVLFFRDQPLTGDQLLDFTRQFGPLFVQPFLADLYGELLILENDKDRPPRLNKMHQDLTGLECPPGEHFLHALAVPDGGGDTIWSSLYAAYDALSKPMQEFVDGLTVTHDCMKNYRTVFQRRGKSAKEIDDWAKKYPPQQHPLVRTHPVTGRKALYVNTLFTIKIDGLDPTESDLLLTYFYNHISKPDFCVRLKWRVGTLAIWDNRCTSHYACADYYPQHRHMQRATTQGDKPY